MLVQSPQRTGALRKLIAPLLIICLSVLGLSAQADNDGRTATSNTRAPIVAAATSIQGCNVGLVMYNGQYKCKNLLTVSQGGLIPEPYRHTPGAAVVSTVVTFTGGGGGGGGGDGGAGGGGGGSRSETQTFDDGSSITTTTNTVTGEVSVTSTEAPMGALISDAAGFSFGGGWDETSPGDAGCGGCGHGDDGSDGGSEGSDGGDGGDGGGDGGG